MEKEAEEAREAAARAKAAILLNDMPALRAEKYSFTLSDYEAIVA